MTNTKLRVLFTGIFLFSFQSYSINLSIDRGAEPRFLKSEYYGHNTVWVRGGLSIVTGKLNKNIPEIGRAHV